MAKAKKKAPEKTPRDIEIPENHPHPAALDHEFEVKATKASNSTEPSTEAPLCVHCGLGEQVHEPDYQP